MRCVIYSRVSTEEQNTDNQIKELTEYAKRQEWSIVEIISDVCSGGKSASEREGLKKVFQMSRQKKCDVVLFWSLDRFSREGSRQTLNYLTKLDNYKVKWHSYTEEYISSLGVFADAIISLMACLAKQDWLHSQTMRKCSPSYSDRQHLSRHTQGLICVHLFAIWLLNTADCQAHKFPDHL